MTIAILPFELEVEGRATIPQMAERAKINVNIASTGKDKATVSREVLDTARQVEILLKDLSAKDATPEAVQAAPLAYWSKTSLSATSHQVHDKQGVALPDRIYNGSINFDIRFRDFKALGGLSATLSALPHVEVQNIQWILTTATEERFRSELRKKATRDAMEKAQDYCTVLGCTNVRPVELREGNISINTNRSHQHHNQQMQMMMAQQRQVQNMSQGRFLSASSSGSSTDEPVAEFEFTPQEIRMDWNVYVKFHADPPAS